MLELVAARVFDESELGVGALGRSQIEAEAGCERTTGRRKKGNSYSAPDQSMKVVPPGGAGLLSGGLLYSLLHLGGFAGDLGYYAGRAAGCARRFPRPACWESQLAGACPARAPRA